MGVNKSITIDGATFRFEVKPMENRPFTDQELKF